MKNGNVVIVDRELWPVEIILQGASVDGGELYIPELRPP